MSIFEPEYFRYSSEGPAFVAQSEALLVSIQFVRHIREAPGGPG